MPEIKFQDIFNNKIREISKEVSEFIDIDPNDPESGKRMVTKSEALCRNLWKMALGFIEVKELKDGSPSEVIHKPDKWAVKEIMDRVDGRTVAAVSVEDNTATISDQIRQTAKDLANAMAEKEKK